MTKYLIRICIGSRTKLRRSDELKYLIGIIKCFFGKHHRHTAISFKTGAWAVHCKRCGKVIEISKNKINSLELIEVENNDTTIR